ncbi:DUF2634 domain-containing protein [Paenibacillus sp. GbtcB18]|uniref:DUF2634 domain-containing protein n=1 Tax=Paenibacillus sp. GbtcB18 TaxID=2824763 RepID=UPI001C2F87B0|nr:DUF2634 domain-containing protein [Paenibacillus sp. GbtcB18]
MSTLPDSSLPPSFGSPESQPSRTFRVDFASKRITGMIDGLEAIKQTVFNILSTERYEYLIHSFDYGSELAGLSGADPLMLQSELKRRVTEALTQDDRITGVSDFQFDFNDDVALISFRVYTIYGALDAQKEVRNLV